MSTGGLTESNVRSFEAFLTIFLSINYTKYLIITLGSMHKNKQLLIQGVSKPPHQLLVIV
jgi:hypothetical protein